MVKLNKIYTRTGDDGTTGLVDGSRVAKSDAIMQAIGDVDEANSAIGVAIAALGDCDEAALLRRIQNDLFDLGADLATPETGEKLEYEPLRITEGQVAAIEKQIDRFNKDLQSLRSFILPGGSPAAAHLHLARTVARRAERMIVELSAQPQELVSGAAIRYMNRLSDFLFVAARVMNDGGRADVLWVPGANR